MISMLEELKKSKLLVLESHFALNSNFLDKEIITVGLNPAIDGPEKVPMPDSTTASYYVMVPSIGVMHAYGCSRCP